MMTSHNGAVMTAEQIHNTLSSIVPFVNTVGLHIDQVAPGTATASLGSTKPVHNHIGTVHAGALYTAGESATGAVVLGLFGHLLPGVFIALKGATVVHSKARQGDLLAHASLVGDPKQVRLAYTNSGKVDFDVQVRFEVDGAEVANIAYQWAVRAPRA